MPRSALREAVWPRHASPGYSREVISWSLSFKTLVKYSPKPTVAVSPIILVRDTNDLYVRVILPLWRASKKDLDANKCLLVIEIEEFFKLRLSFFFCFWDAQKKIKHAFVLLCAKPNRRRVSLSGFSNEIAYVFWTRRLLHEHDFLSMLGVLHANKDAEFSSRRIMDTYL